MSSTENIRPKMSADNNSKMDGSQGKENFGAQFDEKIDPDFKKMCPSQPAATATESKYPVGENRRMIRNVILLSLTFTILFTAYNGMANLQSSIHGKGGLGNWASAVIYVSLIISALFVPTALIGKTGVKWAIFVSISGYLIFIMAQFYPSFYTLLPAAAIIGFCGAPLWAAQSSYLTQMGIHYAGHMSQPAEGVIVRFFGLFFMTYHTNNLFGNLISSTILSSTIFSTSNETVTISSAENEAQKIKINSGRLCGANFCPASFSSPPSANSSVAIHEEEETRDMTRIRILAGVYIAIALVAATLLAFCVDSLSRYGETKREGSTKKLLTATFRQMRNTNQILIIPLTMWAGLGQGFLSADYTAAYITCGWGVEKVGFVLICFGLADSLSSMLYSHVVRWAGRVFVSFFGATLSISLICWLLVWEPNGEENSWYFFVFAGLWGVADSCWQCGNNAYYGVLFSDNSEAAFSNYRLWESIGFVTAFVVANLICVRAKLFLMLATLVVGMAGFSLIEIRERRRKQKNREF